MVEQDIKKKEFTLKAILSAMAATVGILFTLAGCGEKSDITGVDGQTGEESSVSEAADMTEIISGTDGAETEGEAETEDETKTEDVVLKELFGSKGAYLQELADNGEAINEMDKADFLEMFGFGDSEPFYVHTEEDGYALVELYYDEEREVGCGIIDGENTGDYSYGFAFNTCKEVSWHYPDPFSVLSIYGTNGEEAVTDYKKNYEYDSEGRLVHFQSTGMPLESPLVEGDDNEDWYNQYIIDVAFTYDPQGKLTKKIYKHSPAWYMPFGTMFSWQVSHYDERERLAHTAAYVTHGSVEGYYIYQGESDEPAYFLELDHGWDVNFYRFSRKNDNWEFGEYRRDPNADWTTYEIEPGEETAFLAEQGYSEADLFYEYEYVSSWDPHLSFGLSLYCDPELNKGTGFIKVYEDGEYVAEYPNLEIFTFDGYESYLHNAVDPFSVCSYYFFDGRATTFLRDGMTVDEYFRELEPDLYGLYFDYDEDGRLMYIFTGVTHGGIHTFYIYKNNRNGYESDRPLYMLEVDPGWGVTFYRFDIW